MPVPILSTWRGVHVEDRVYSLLGAEIDNPIQPFETLRLEYSGIHVIFEMTIVEGYPNAIQSKIFVKFGVCLSEEVF